MRILEVIYNGFHKALLSPASCPASAKPKSKKAARTRARCKFQRMFGIWNAQLGATAASQMAIATRNKTSVAQKRLMWVKQCHKPSPVITMFIGGMVTFPVMAGLLLFYHVLFTLRCLVLDHGAMVPWGVSTSRIHRCHLSVPRAATLSKGIVLSTLTAPRPCHGGPTKAQLGKPWARFENRPWIAILSLNIECAKLGSKSLIRDLPSSGGHKLIISRTSPDFSSSAKKQPKVRQKRPWRKPKLSKRNLNQGCRGHPNALGMIKNGPMAAIAHGGEPLKQCFTRKSCNLPWLQPGFEMHRCTSF